LVCSIKPPGGKSGRDGEASTFLAEGEKAAAQNAVSQVVIKLLEGASTYTNVLIDKLDGIGYEQSILQPLLLCLGYMV
jgi:hypothetical protein